VRSDDLRFHIASLVAVFLALGIGIFIGTAFVGAPVVERRINTLNRTLADKLTELSRQTDEAAKSEEALRALLPRLVGGRLTGRAVLLLRTGDYPEAARDAQTVLEAAGARVTATLTLPADGWGRERFAGEGDGGAQTPAAAAAERELAALAAALLDPSREETPPPAALLNALRRSGSLSGDLPQTPARLVVLVAGVQGPPPAPGRGRPVSPREEQARVEAAERAVLVDRINQHLARAFADGGATAVVGVEPFAADRSSVPAFEAADVTSVDAVDRAAGQIALVFALLGDKGAFGLKATAARVLPEGALLAAPAAEQQHRPEPGAAAAPPPP